MLTTHLMILSDVTHRTGVIMPRFILKGDFMEKNKYLRYKTQLNSKYGLMVDCDKLKKAYKGGVTHCGVYVDTDSVVGSRDTSVYDYAEYIIEMERKLQYMVDLKNLGLKCKEFRVSLGVLQSDVANDTGYSLENISAFETGRNDNARILLWYFMHGMTIDHIQ